MTQEGGPNIYKKLGVFLSPPVGGAELPSHINHNLTKAITLMNQAVTLLEHQRISPQNTLFRGKWAGRGLSGFGSRERLTRSSVYRPDSCSSQDTIQMANGSSLYPGLIDLCTSLYVNRVFGSTSLYVNRMVDDHLSLYAT